MTVNCPFHFQPLGANQISKTNYHYFTFMVKSIQEQNGSNGTKCIFVFILSFCRHCYWFKSRPDLSLFFFVLMLFTLIMKHFVALLLKSIEQKISFNWKKRKMCERVWKRVCIVHVCVIPVHTVYVKLDIGFWYGTSIKHSMGTIHAVILVKCDLC